MKMTIRRNANLASAKALAGSAMLAPWLYRRPWCGKTPSARCASIAKPSPAIAGWPSLPTQQHDSGNDAANIRGSGAVHRADSQGSYLADSARHVPHSLGRQSDHRFSRGQRSPTSFAGQTDRVFGSTSLYCVRRSFSAGHRDMPAKWQDGSVLRNLHAPRVQALDVSEVFSSDCATMKLLSMGTRCDGFQARGHTWRSPIRALCIAERATIRICRPNSSTRSALTTRSILSTQELDGRVCRNIRNDLQARMVQVCSSKRRSKCSSALLG